MKGRVFVIGASFGGVSALCKLLGSLPADFPAPIFITQHIAPDSPGTLPELFGNAGRLPALHPPPGTGIEPGRIYVAPPDRHLLVRNGYVMLSDGEPEHFVRPAIDPMFCSAALAYGPAVVGVVLTGQLDDGAAGLAAIKDHGGTAIVQDPREADAASMPEAALRHVAVDYCCGLSEMARVFVRLARAEPFAAVRRAAPGSASAR